MTASAGSLVVSLGLDAAEYTSGLTKAEFQARKLGEAIGTNIRTGALAAGSALAGISAAAVSLAAGFNSILEGAAKFQDFADEIGDSAENIASLAVAAGTAGVSMESVAGASIRLTMSLVGVDDESKAAGAALSALGLNIQTFKKLDPVAQYEAASKALAGYADGAGKTAVAVALWGKSGAEQLKVMGALAEQGGRSVILSAEQIAQADSYLDRQGKLRAELGLYATALATHFIQPTNVLLTLVGEAARDVLGLSRSVDTVAVNSGVRAFAEDAGRSLAAMADSVSKAKREFTVLIDTVSAYAAISGKLASFDLSGARQLGADFRKKYGLDDNGFKLEAATGVKAAETFVQAYDRVLANSKRSSFAAVDPRRLDLDPDGKVRDGRPELKPNGQVKPPKKRAVDDPTKGVLENELRSYEALAQQEEEILRARNRMLDLVNSESLISTHDFYAGKRIAQEEALTRQVALYDREIAALQAYQAKAGKATDREAAQGKINDLTEKKSDLYRQAGQAALEMGYAEASAVRSLEQQMLAVNAQVLELTGNLQAAAAVRLDSQFKDLTVRLTANGDAAGLAQLQRLKDLQGAQSAYAAQAASINEVTERLRIQEDRIGLSRQLGATTELGALQQLGVARSAAVEQMRAMVDAQEAIARASSSPALVLQAEQARLALDQLLAAANPVADKLNSMFETAAGDAFADIITGSKSAKDAFRSFANSVANDLARLAAQQISSGLFGRTGDAGGGLGGLLSGIFSGLFGRATGGLVAPGGLVRVNENGPELLDYQGKKYLMNGAVNARVTPLSGGDGGESSVAGRTAAPHVSIAIDARGADAGVEARLRAAMPEIVRQTTAAVQSQANRGGQFARAVGRRP